jgi:hypothetical protein
LLPHQRTLLPLLVLVAALASGCNPAAAAESCDSIYPTAILGPYSGTDKRFSSLCNVRNMPESKCRQVPGFIEWQPGGSICYFTPGEGAAAVEPPPPVREAVVNMRRARYLLKLCNRGSHGKITAAIAVFDTPSATNLTIYAWYPIESGQCINTVRRNFGNYGSHSIYIHGKATDKVDWFWPDPAKSDTKYCVDPKNRYQRENSAGYSCKPGEELRGFAKTTVRKSGEGEMTFTYNFN